MKNREEPSVVSTRPTQLRFDFESFEAEPARAEEPHGQSCLADTEQPALSEPELPREANASPEVQQNLMELIVDPDNLARAWQQVRSNRGAPGPDGMTIADFPDWFVEHWPTICQQLLGGTYRPQPVRRVTIPKPDGGERLLGIPNVLDRLIQQAVGQVLTPIFDPGFSESSFGFRPNRSAHGAIKQIQGTIRQGNRWVVDVDLSKFFDRVDHDILMSRVARKIRDKRLLKLIGGVAQTIRNGCLGASAQEVRASWPRKFGPSGFVVGLRWYW
jgi:RNA-directed DNA polymerase